MLMSLVAGGLCVMPPLASAEDPSAFEFDLELIDGSRLLGTVVQGEIAVQTRFGRHAVACERLRRIEVGEEGESSRFLLRNDDVLQGSFVIPSIEMATVLGELRVPLKVVRAIEISATGELGEANLADGLIVHFPFAGEGVDVQNLAGLTPSGRLVEGRREGGAVVLDGKGDHVVLANHEAFENLQALSVSIWARLRSFNPGGGANEYGFLVNKGDDLWWNPCFALGYSKNSGVGREAAPGPAVFTVGTFEKGGQAECRVQAEGPLEVDRWYHLAGTYDGERVRLYVDGKLVGERDYAGELRRDGAPILLGGGRLGGVEFGNHFTTDATVDDFRLYRRALSAGEVRILYRTERPDRGRIPERPVSE